jgi:sugar/nucleoside kinase (ribokinase family)
VSAPDFVAVGHVTFDRFGDVRRPGGAALYAAVTAHRLGLSVGILTSHGEDFPLDLLPPQIEVVSVPARETTTFEMGESNGARTLTLREMASPITVRDVPVDWLEAPIVLLGPVIAEVDPLIASVFTDASIGAAAQGWLRDVAPGGLVDPAEWDSPDYLLGRVQALFLSVEDIRGLEEEANEWFQRVPIGALTAGRSGALLFVNGERYDVPVRPATEVDATGAGDVFAATFLTRYHIGGDAWEAAAAATCAARLSVGGEGWSTVPDRKALDDALMTYHRERDDLRSALP